MGKLESFDIFLDNEQVVFEGGQVVCGKVLVEMNEPMKVRGIRLEFHGGAHVHWSERHTTGSGKDQRTVTNNYSAAETFFHFEVVLFGKAAGQGGDNSHHPAGRHLYPFQYTLPQNLPSSFEGLVGRVRYWLQGTIDKPWKFDHHCKKAFTVLSILDLNVQPNVMSSQQGQSEKTLCCWCCKSGPITAVFQIDRSGYVPGEYITINGEVDNQSNRTMTCSKVQLKMYVAYHATTSTYRETRVVAELKKGEIPQGGSEVWSGEQIQIPPLPQSDLVYCHIIDIKYCIELVVDPSGPSYDLEVPLEIVIGTVPLQNVFGWYQGDPMPAVPSAPLPAEPYAHDAAPSPLYEECVLGKVNLRDEGDNEYTRGNMDWAPVYPYFSTGQPSQPYPPYPPIVQGLQ